MLIPPTTKGYKGFFVPKNPQKYKGDIEKIIWRSTWEKHVMDTLDSNPNVLEWSSEQIVIKYLNPVDNQVHRYLPDMWCRLRRADGSIKCVLIEVKPYKQTKPPKQPKRRTKKFLIEAATYAVNQAKWTSATKYCEQRGWQFIILTEQEIFRGVNL
jgi:hypothetical protein